MPFGHLSRLSCLNGKALCCNFPLVFFLVKKLQKFINSVELSIIDTGITVLVMNGILMATN